jgi:hypothetical protein
MSLFVWSFRQILTPAEFLQFSFFLFDRRFNMSSHEDMSENKIKIITVYNFIYIFRLELYLARKFNAM